MTLLDYALLTLEELKIYLDISDNSEDDYLILLINNITETMNSAVGYIIAEQSYSGEEGEQPQFIIRGTDSKLLVLPFREITNTLIFKIEYSSLDNDGIWTEIDANNYWYKKSGIIEYNFGFNSWQNYRFTFSAGYNPIPYDIKMACMQMLGGIYNGSDGISGEKIGNYSISYKEKDNSILNNIINIYKI